MAQCSTNVPWHVLVAHNVGVAKGCTAGPCDRPSDSTAGHGITMARTSGGQLQAKALDVVGHRRHCRREVRRVERRRRCDERRAGAPQTTGQLGGSTASSLVMKRAVGCRCEPRWPPRLRRVRGERLGALRERHAGLVLARLGLQLPAHNNVGSSRSSRGCSPTRHQLRHYGTHPAQR